MTETRIRVPSGRTRLLKLENRLLPIFRRSLRLVAFDVLSENGLHRSLTAASLGGDGSLDPIQHHWGKQVPHLTDQLEVAFKSAAKQMTAVPEFKGFEHELMSLATGQPLEDYLGGVTNRVVGVGNTMFRLAATSLSDGIQAGEAHPELAARVRNSLKVTVNRADTIARTEALGAMNAADTAVYRAAGLQGIKLKREWLAAEDDRTRPEHADANGQVVELDEPFSVGGENLQYPGDAAGSPENVINCRCTTVPIKVEDDAELAAGDSFGKLPEAQPYHVAYKEANPGTGVHFRNNCHFAVNAMEMRARGYDVVAAQTYGKTGRYMDTIKGDWINPVTKRNPNFVRIGVPRGLSAARLYDENLAALEKVTAGWPAGARGTIAGSWTRGGGAHIFNMYKDDKGVLRFIDGQVSKKDVSSYLQRLDGIEIMRVDNLDFVPERMKVATTPRLEPVTPANQLRQAQAIRMQMTENYRSYMGADLDALDSAIATLKRRLKL